MITRLLLVSSVLLVLSIQGTVGAGGRPDVADPFAFLRPMVAVTGPERQRLASGEPVARIVPARDHEVTAFAAVRVDVEPDRLIAWMRQIAVLKQSRRVLAIRRFSDPPQLDDLVGLTLDDSDREAIRQCRPGRCDIKLSAAEMTRLQHADITGTDGAAALDLAFRELLLERVRVYATGGRAALGDLHDRRRPVSLGAHFGTLVSRTPFLVDGFPQFTEYLLRYPQAPPSDIESFFYWSKEALGGKPIISIIHVAILNGRDGAQPDVLVAGAGLLATHYVTASIGLTALVTGPDGVRYLVYVNRSDIDMLGGVWGGVVRAMMERRLKAEASGVLRTLRTRLESGDPPPSETP